ncbi:hypothetical protein [Anaerosporobacter faecicola]|uniref:hypothetical protein n=1 Tax=Anaerosporobacter faecicola TaxID=2718714 RepID=UPI00143CA1A4|nr:hypothetical protein [Anaerosporobacter faecicola]
MFSILGVIVMVTFIVAIAVFGYYLIYVNNINKKIQRGQVSNKKLIDMPKIIMIAIIVLLLFYSIILSVELSHSNKDVAIVNHNNFAVIDLSDYTFFEHSGLRENDDASFAKVYSKEVNKGYDKSVVRDGDFVFTIFVRNTDQDDFHPDYLCYVDYVGEVKDELLRYNNCEYIDGVSGKETGGRSGGGGAVQTKLLYIGNLNEGSSFRITECILDAAGEREFAQAEEEAYKADKGEFPSFAEYALSSGSTTITIE